MRNLLVGLITLLWFMSGNIALANSNLCIALTNFGESPVEFSGIVDPGYVYTVQPKQSATLSSDHMVGACIRRGKNDCTVSIFILDGSGNGENIDHLPRGTRIIYNSFHQYYVDVNANVQCTS